MEMSEITNIINNVISEEVRNAILSESQESKKEVYHIKMNGEPIASFNSEDEAKEALPNYKAKSKGELIIEKGVYESYADMIEKLDDMGQQLEEKENSNMKNQEPMEGNAFTDALLKAKEEGKDKFEVDGKEFNVEECWNQLSEEEDQYDEEDKTDCQECGSEMKEQEESSFTDKLYYDFSSQAYDETNPEDFGDEFDYADNVIRAIIDIAHTNGVITDEMLEDDDQMAEIEDELKMEFADTMFDSYRQGGGDMGDNEDDDSYGEDYDSLEETEEGMENDPNTKVNDTYDDMVNRKEVSEGQVCNECGGEMKEGLCNECGNKLMENKKKRVLRLKESEMVAVIKKIVSESIPSITKTAQAQSKKDNESHAKEVATKIKKSQSFDGNDNPEFPKPIGKGEKVARQNTKEEDEIVADNRGGGLEDLHYDIEPSQQFKDRLKKALEGDSTMGNSQDAGNVVKSDLGKKIADKVERKKNKEKEEFEVSWGHSWKSPEEVKIVKESKTNFQSILNEEIEKMKKIADYNKKTQ